MASLTQALCRSAAVFDLCTVSLRMIIIMVVFDPQQRLKMNVQNLLLMSVLETEKLIIFRGGGRKFCLGGQILTVAREARAKFLGTRPFN